MEILDKSTLVLSPTFEIASDVDRIRKMIIRMIENDGSKQCGWRELSKLIWSVCQHQNASGLIKDGKIILLRNKTRVSR